MSDFQAIADRFEIEALRGEFTDALMMRDYDRFATLFTLDCVWRIPYINVEMVRRDEIRAGIERMQGLRDYFVQTPYRAPSNSMATLRSDGRMSWSLGTCGMAIRSSITPSITTASNALRTAGNSPSASTRSDTSTPANSRAQRHSRARRTAARSPTN